MSVCPSCGAESSADNAFCPKCGTTLSPNSAPAFSSDPAPQAVPVWDASPEHVASVASAMNTGYDKQDVPTIHVPGGDDGASGSAGYTGYTGNTTDAPVDTLPTASRIMGLVSMITGIASATLFMLMSGFWLSPVAIILSIMANKKNTSTVKNSKATIGLITGIVGAVLTFFMVIALNEG